LRFGRGPFCLVSLTENTIASPRDNQTNDRDNNDDFD
jgi:hypothetical protein